MKTVNGRPFPTAIDFSDKGESFTTQMDLIADILDEVSDYLNSTVDGGIEMPDAIPITMGAGSNIALDTVTGTQIGTSSLQKLGIYGATPIVAPSSASIAALTPVQGSFGYTTAAQFVQATGKLEAISAALQSVGLIKAI